MTTSNIHAVTNDSESVVALMLFNKNGKRSYDLMLGPKRSVAYANLFGPDSAEVPTAESAAAFPDAHVRMRIGNSLYALYNRGSRVRIATGGTFNEHAPALPGYAGPGAMTLIVGPDRAVTGRIVPFVTGPELAAVSWMPGRYGLYGVNGGSLTGKAFLTTAWWPWEDLGKPAVGLRGQLAAVSWFPANYGIYAIGNDGAMHEKIWATTAWKEWNRHENPRGETLKSLSATSWMESRYGIYAVSASGKLYQRWWETLRWSDWEDLGRPNSAALAGPVTAVAYSGNRYAIYALGTDGNIYQKWWAIGGWSNWESIGTPASRLKSLTSAAWNDRTYLVAGVGTDGALYAREYNPSGWKNWMKIEPPANLALRGPVAAISWGTGTYAYYAQGTDEVMYQRYRDAWEPLDGS